MSPSTESKPWGIPILGASAPQGPGGELRHCQGCSCCFAAVVSEPAREGGLWTSQHSQGFSQPLTRAQAVAQPESFTSPHTGCRHSWHQLAPCWQSPKCLLVRARMLFPLWSELRHASGGSVGTQGLLRVFAPWLMSAAPGPAGFLNAQAACSPPYTWQCPNLLTLVPSTSRYCRRH